MKPGICWAFSYGKEFSVGDYILSFDAFPRTNSSYLHPHASTRKRFPNQWMPSTETRINYRHSVNERNQPASRIRVSRSNETDGFPGSLRKAIPKRGGESNEDAKTNERCISAYKFRQSYSASPRKRFPNQQRPQFLLDLQNLNRHIDVR